MVCNFETEVIAILSMNFEAHMNILFKVNFIVKVKILAFITWSYRASQIMLIVEPRMVIIL